MVVYVLKPGVFDCKMVGVVNLKHWKIVFYTNFFIVKTGILIVLYKSLNQGEPFL